MRDRLIIAFLGAAALSLVACGSSNSSNPDAGTGPTISMISWNPESPCTSGVPSNYNFKITATDVETPNNLTYNLSVTGCTGTWDTSMNQGTLQCPNAMNYNGSASVTDGDGNTTTKTFTITTCMSGHEP